MTTLISIIEDHLEHDKYLLNVYMIVEDEEPRFALHFEMHEKSPARAETFMTVDMHYSVKNPLNEGSVIISGATIYATCLAYAGFKFGAKAVKQCYRQSKYKNPNMNVRDRITDIAERMSKKGDGAKSAIIDALLDCIPLK